MKYFQPHEFACRCGCGGGFAQMDQAFLLRLEQARGISTHPFVLTSAYRCARHNKKERGSPTSSHLKGLGVDIAAPGSQARYGILTALLKAGFERVGIGKDFIHVDEDSSKASKVVWLY